MGHNAVPIFILLVTAVLAVVILVNNTGSGGFVAGTVNFPSYFSQERISVDGTETVALSPAATAKSASVDEAPNNAQRALSEARAGLSGEDVATAALPVQSTAAMAVGYPISQLRPTVATNPPQCAEGQPLTDPIEPYKKCPLPGLNNLLYTQINRWYCAYRDGQALSLRDRSCTKVSGSIIGAVVPFRYSTILTVKYEEARPKGGGGSAAAICWSDVASNRQRLPRECGWEHIPSFYGSAEWWQARALIDFHQTYYDVASHYIHRLFGGERFVAVHLRRGDYYSHCRIIVKRREPVWVTFKHTPRLIPDDRFANCYPDEAAIVAMLAKVVAQTGIRKVLIATNTPREMANVTRDPRLVAGASAAEVVLFDDARLAEISDPSSSAAAAASSHVRDVDRTIVEMAMLSMGHYFIFNAYSSFSGTVYEQARIHGRITERSGGGDANVVTW